jgi:putative heme transporter
VTAADDTADVPDMRPRPLGERFRSWGSSAWGAIGVIILAAGVVWLTWTLRTIVLPVLAGIILAVALAPVVRWLMAARMPRGIASMTALVLAIGALVAFGYTIAPTIADQFAGIGDAVREAVDRLERWVERERPFGFTGDDVEQARERVAGVGVNEAVDVVGVSPAAGLRYVGTTLAAVLIALVSSFFFLRDGPAIREAIVARARPGRGAALGAACDGAVGGVRAFLAGAALLGIVEGTAVGITLWLTGSELALVMAALTFMGAFVPFIGAILTGILAVAVALVTAGTGPAIIVAIVIVIVQQFDNDLLAPVIYGKLLQLHPLVVILSTAAGIEIAGVIGAFATVPLVAAATGAHRKWSEARSGTDQGFSADEPAPGDDPIAST